MQIANPIYDSVFKFLMEDTKSAILLISTIIDQPIETLEFLPQEGTTYIQEHSLTVYRLDFSAKIKIDKNNSKQVLIEVQKAKLPSDIMRFRRYLGEQYKKKSNRYMVRKTLKNKTVKKIDTPLPIINIYFLGYPLKYHRVPVIKINRQYYDVVHNKILTGKKEVFIESLTHDGYVIQISELREQQQTEIEQLLSIFDQHKQLIDDEHILNLNEANYPQKYHPIIRRLQRAVAEPEVRKKMDVEDDYLEYLQEKERALAEKNKIIEVQDQALEEKDQALEQKDKFIAQQNQLIAKLKKQYTEN